jgi:4-hydroxy-4-methyl-2-oxoglutarate aldolase
MLVKRFVVLSGFVLLCGAFEGRAQVNVFPRDQVLKYTAQNPFERFPDGRPKVPDAMIEKLRNLSAEDVWTVLEAKGFHHQFAANWHILHPGKKLIGRAFTVQFMPIRPDVVTVDDADAKSKGLAPGSNQRAIDMLQRGDVAVADLNGKVQDSTFVGDNLAYYIMRTTGTGLVVDGAIRDLEGISPMDMAVYYRGADPGANRVSMLTGVNVPVRIGDVTVMPGDVVFGDREGVYFIPPQFVEEVITRAATTRIHDEWTKKKFDTGLYKSSDIYGRPKSPELIKEYEEYLKEHLGKP